MLKFQEDGQACLFDPVIFVGKMFRGHSQAGSPKGKTSASSSKRSSELSSIPFMSLDLTPGAGNLLDEFYWEILSPWRGGASILNTGLAPRSVENVYSLWQILEEQPHPKYYLTRKACLGILRRAEERGKELPRQLKEALEVQAGLRKQMSVSPQGGSYHINQRNEGIDLEGVSGALMATQNMQMQTFVTQPEIEETIGFDGYNGDLTGSVSATLGVNCGMSTGRNGVIKPVAFTQNQRDEVRDLRNVAGALCSSPGAKHQTYIASGVVTKGDGTAFLVEDKHPSLTSGGGQAGQGYPCVMAAGFLADAPATAGTVGYQEGCAPTLRSKQVGPGVLCLNDQGGQFMNLSQDITGTLRSQMAGHPPLVLESNQNHATVREDGVCTTLPAAMGMGGGYVPMVYDNHGKDCRYNGPLHVAPTVAATYGTGGNNVPLVDQPEETFCIVGNIIDRQPENGGNGLGCQKDVAYTLTGMDRHAVFSRQRVDVFKEGDVVSTESARQHKDATDLIMQEQIPEIVGTLGRSDHHGINNQYVDEGKCIVEGANLIRRLTPLECERLQGFPDYWTDIPGASDSSRYKALGNSVAIPCVDFVLNGMATVLRQQYAA